MTGRLFVISAPSGAGKTTLGRMLIEARPELIYSVSYTTRPPRPGEVDGRDYHFVTTDRFQDMIDRDRFLEWADVFGRRYGTGRDFVEPHLAAGRDVLVDVDVIGARSIRRNHPLAVFIFIVPPSLKELKRRLLERSTESEEQLKLRLDRIRDEIDQRNLFDYLIVNDRLDQALADLIGLLQTDRLRMNRTEEFWPGFFSVS